MFGIWGYFMSLKGWKWVAIFGAVNCGIAALSGWLAFGLAVFGWLFFVPSAIYSIDHK